MPCSLEVMEMKWWTRGDSNPRPPRCERGALPAELLAHEQQFNFSKRVGACQPAFHIRRTQRARHSARPRPDMVLSISKSDLLMELTAVRLFRPHAGLRFSWHFDTG